MTKISSNMIFTTNNRFHFELTLAFSCYFSSHQVIVLCLQQILKQVCTICWRSSLQGKSKKTDTCEEEDIVLHYIICSHSMFSEAFNVKVLDLFTLSYTNISLFVPKCFLQDMSICWFNVFVVLFLCFYYFKSKSLVKSYCSFIANLNMPEIRQR